MFKKIKMRYNRKSHRLSKNIFVDSGVFLVVGSSGSGKDRGHIIPNVFKNDYDYIFVELDGKLRNNIEKSLKKEGYTIIVLQSQNAENIQNYLLDACCNLLCNQKKIAVFLEMDEETDPSFFEVFAKLFYAKRCKLLKEYKVRPLHMYFNDVDKVGFNLGQFYHILRTCKNDKVGASILSTDLESVSSSFGVQGYFEDFVKHIDALVNMGLGKPSHSYLADRLGNPTTVSTEFWEIPLDKCSIQFQDGTIQMDKKYFCKNI